MLFYHRLFDQFLLKMFTIVSIVLNDPLLLYKKERDKQTDRYIYIYRERKRKMMQLIETMEWTNVSKLHNSLHFRRLLLLLLLLLLLYVNDDENLRTFDVGLI